MKLMRGEEMALIHIGNKSFELLHENRNGWNLEAFRDRYSEVLDRYDYIIGDWGYNQLRLKGFFRDSTQKATKDNVYSSISDYINEYCNFGCAYFILEKKHSSKQDADVQEELDEEYAAVDLSDEHERAVSGNHARAEQADKPQSAPAQEDKRKKNDGDSSSNGSRSRNQHAKGEPSKQKREFYYRKGQRFKKGSKSAAASEAAAAVEQP